MVHLQDNMAIQVREAAYEKSGVAVTAGFGRSSSEQGQQPHHSMSKNAKYLYAAVATMHNRPYNLRQNMCPLPTRPWALVHRSESSTRWSFRRLR